MEEQLWAAKSRIDWLTLGDSNTSYFHASVIQRRRHNRISAIKDSVGNWVFEEHLIRDYISSDFKNLLSPVFVQPYLPLPTNILGVMNNNLFVLSYAPPSTDEIKDALWDLKPNKAPGFDGFQPAYFQKCWDSTRDIICRDIQDCFISESVPITWNQTLICLIPKDSQPTEANHLRPISLCSTLYKIVTKILVKRLKNHLPNLISFNQGAFVPGRKPADNIVIAQELVNSFQRKKGDGNGWMMIKLDLEKAYDKINWSFISQVLQYFNFPSKWINLIMNCISSVQHSLIINGNTTDFFSSSRGIRQGDPMSPYIFILCMEIISSMIKKKVDNKRWIAAKTQDISLSHLLYADDVLLFAKVNRKSIKAIQSVLKDFMDTSGLNANLAKSYVWFSPNTPSHIRNSTSSSLGIQENKKPGIYLGITLGITGHKRDFDHIVDRIKSKVNDWKGKYLS